MKKSSASRHFQGHELGLWGNSISRHQVRTAISVHPERCHPTCWPHGVFEPLRSVAREKWPSRAKPACWEVSMSIVQHSERINKDQQESKKVLADMIVCWSLGFLNLPWNLSLVPADWGRGQRRFLVLGNGAHHDLQQNGFVGDTCWMSIGL